MTTLSHQPTQTIKLIGPDAARFLSGQVTQKVADLPPGETRYTFICDAKGRIQFHATLALEDSSFLITTEATQAEALLQRLDRYLIADDCALTLLPDIIPAFSSAHPPSHPDLAEAFPAETGLLDHAVSFAKGCYLGQEVISRMKRAGKTNRNLVPLSLPLSLSTAPPEFPFTLPHPETGKAALTITSAHWGYLHRNAADLTTFTHEGFTATLT
ncbi:MAG: hypothetical protein AAGC74_05805 [Verrucomicrobiota bacterium]